ncbi:Arabidopsis Toxicos en Levadura 96 [Hibiscus trionum]|uniref:RING-type E3 ubiquitin transferase n=1 Tax=Hibiscus trionum TaxID=183268 RepID=A0A9W7IWH4_HIBTR|nr:Arabidopsis Toxicos en Levadura 96 [Hibiscus trionum]
MAPFNLFFFLFLCLSFLPPISTDGALCDPVLCQDVLVEFPFRLANQPDCCGDPNFNLSISCTSRYQEPAQTIINFPLSGEFTVDTINYWSWTPYLQMSDSCIPERLLEGLDLSGTPFRPRYPENYTFFYCPSADVSHDFPAIRFSCLSGTNSSVWGIPSIAYNQSSMFSSCAEMANILVPLPTPFWPMYNITSIVLSWDQPDCSFPPCNHCGNSGSNCRPENGNGECPRKKRGISNGIKFALIFTLGTPIILIVSSIIIYNVRVNLYDRHHRPNVEIPGSNAESQLPAVAVNGLDGSRIEAYPITTLCENVKLPRADDNTCSICLSEYEAKETIRTIPDCDHYFHSSCIDEWLVLNAACPICRNTPDYDSGRLMTRSTLASSRLPL